MAFIEPPLRVGLQPVRRARPGETRLGGDDPERERPEERLTCRVLSGEPIRLPLLVVSRWWNCWW